MREHATVRLNLAATSEPLNLSRCCDSEKYSKPCATVADRYIDRCRVPDGVFGLLLENHRARDRLGRMTVGAVHGAPAAVLACLYLAVAYRLQRLILFLGRYRQAHVGC